MDFQVRKATTVNRVNINLGTLNVRFFDGFVASFDYRTRNACWSCQKITANKDTSTKTASRQNSEFKEDASVPELFRPKLTDYKNSGFDRGHLVPAADLNYHSQKAMDDTFHLTNVR
jgi:endonuclease G